MSTQPEIVLAAGGTGGHIFPAQSLARELMARGRSLALVTDRRGAAYGGALSRVDTYRLHAGTLSGRSLGGKIAGLAEVAMGFWQARRLLAGLKPRAVVGFGGYPSLPTLLAACAARIATLIHEQNAVLGRVNRLLAPWATLIATSYPDTARLRPQDRAKATLTGTPVRAQIAELRQVPYGAPGNEGSIDLLVLGGSQGAAILSQVVPAALALLPEGLRRRLRVSQQCRPDDIALVRTLYAAAAVEAELGTFFHDIPSRLAGVQLVIARAGASTVSELAVAGRPAILVPYGLATDRHQSLNARALAQAGGAWTMEEDELSAQALASRLTELFARPARLSAAAAGAHKAGRPEAAIELADLVERLAPGNGGRRDAGGRDDGVRERAA